LQFLSLTPWLLSCHLGSWTYNICVAIVTNPFKIAAWLSYIAFALFWMVRWDKPAGQSIMYCALWAIELYVSEIDIFACCLTMNLLFYITIILLFDLLEYTWWVSNTRRAWGRVRNLTRGYARGQVMLYSHLT
jgi:hypothetical protein